MAKANAVAVNSRLSPLCLLVIVVVLVLGVHANTKPNLLFIIDETARVDDFEMFGGLKGITPSLKQFFSKPGSILVEQMHADYAMCNPSRTSLLLGRSPDTTGVKTNYLDWRTNPEAKSWQSLPRFLKDNGYYTMLGGKVFHAHTVDTEAFSVIYNDSPDIDFTQCQRDKKAVPFTLSKGKTLPQSIGCKTTAKNLQDLLVAQAAATELATFANDSTLNTQPFALFIGFEVPHLPIRVTNQYFLAGDVIFPSVPLQEPPRVAAEYSETYSFSAPLRNVPPPGSIDQIPPNLKGPGPFKGKGAPLDVRRRLLQLHYSGLNLMDAACGIVFNAVESLGYGNNTLTIFLTDHGFGYGETRLWEKDLPMDIATRIPLLVHAPWLNAPAFHTGPEFFMNAVDLYRTIAGFLQLQDKVDSTVQGRDFSSYFLQHPSMSTSKSTPSTAAYSQVVRCTKPKLCKKTLSFTDILGYTVRTRDYRYIVYFNVTEGQIRNFSEASIVAEELYDHRFDNLTIYNPNGATYVDHEFHNIVAQGQFADVAKQLFWMICRQFQSIPKAIKLPLHAR